jgi:hypothetical protein
MNGMLLPPVITSVGTTIARTVSSGIAPSPRIATS